METKPTTKEQIERILTVLNMDDEIFWPIVAAAAHHRDLELFKLAQKFNFWSSDLFQMVAELKKA